MDRSRRQFIRFTGIGTFSLLTGCMKAAQEEYIPVVARNDSEHDQILAMSATSPPNEGGGFVEYFSKTRLVYSYESIQIDEAIAIDDARPDEFFVIATLEGGTSTVATTPFPISSEKLLFNITDQNGLIVRSI